ncbi:MAG TPA: hypothetical protein VG294_18185 [Solirubrobacteraceae bacterium]|nr:hypothetical protein [Solirubrobacteraceae bacterium]
MTPPPPEDPPSGDSSAEPPDSSAEPPDQAAERRAEAAERLEYTESSPGAEAIEAVAMAIEAEDEGSGRLRRYTALGIVIVSIFAAAMAWRASVADDGAGSKEQLAEQNLLQQQELTATDEASVFHDLSLFGRYEEHVNLAVALERDAAQATPAATARALSVRAQQERQLAHSEQALFEGPLPTTRRDGSVSYDAAYARSQAQLRDVELLDLQPPEQLRAQASTLHEKGVRLTGLAVLFVAALVLLTFAELSGPAVARLFAFSGGGVAVAAAVLFLLI